MYYIQQNLNRIFEDYKFYDSSLHDIQNKLQIQQIHNLSFNTGDVIKNILKKSNQCNKPIDIKPINKILSKKKDNNIEIMKSDIISIVSESNIPQVFDDFTLFKINNQEDIYTAFCILINNDLYFSKDNSKRMFMEKLKNKLAIEFENFKINYKYIKIDKQTLLNDLLVNKPVMNDFFYKYLADYFNINFINFNFINKKANFYNDFIIQRASLVIFSNDKNIYIQRNNKSFSIIGSEEILLKLQIKKPNDKNLLKLSLPELQKLATDKKNSNQKKGKINNKNKTKSELIEEISQL